MKKLRPIILLISILLPGLLFGPAETRPSKYSIRSFNGKYNNIKKKNWGKAFSKLMRKAKPNYKNKLGEISTESLPNPRTVSNTIFDQQVSIPNSRKLSNMVWLWGQFLDHDISLTESDNSRPMPIAVPRGDRDFDPLATGNVSIPFSRSRIKSNPRTQVNQITSFIDGSNIYGSDEDRADELRTFEGGLLKQSEHELLPFNLNGLDNHGGPSPSLFLAGDVRVNENIALIAMHTLFVREHNRKAKALAAINPLLSDEELYQKSRNYVIALLQKITYEEFLPALLGKELPRYTGYKKNIRANINNEFSTAAYRFGHSSISSNIDLVNNQDEVIDSVNIKNAFFNTKLINNYDVIGQILKGISSSSMQEIDTQVISDLRNFLFGPPGAGGLDLVALNIQRGRDHGISNINVLREAYGLKQYSNIDELSSNQELNNKLKDLYGSIELIDPWVAMLAEDHVSGSSLGETAQAIIADQFIRLRDGDRFWYQKTLRIDHLIEVGESSLTQIIERNTQITDLNENIFTSK